MLPSVGNKFAMQKVQRIDEEGSMGREIQFQSALGVAVGRTTKQ